VRWVGHVQGAQAAQAALLACHVSRWAECRLHWPLTSGALAHWIVACQLPTATATRNPQPATAAHPPASALAPRAARHRPHPRCHVTAIGFDIDCMVQYHTGPQVAIRLSIHKVSLSVAVRAGRKGQPHTISGKQRIMRSIPSARLLRSCCCTMLLPG
jgi:hypothetical protein